MSAPTFYRVLLGTVVAHRVDHGPGEIIGLPPAEGDRLCVGRQPVLEKLPMRTYPVLKPLQHDGQNYGPGTGKTFVKMQPEQAALIEPGVLGKPLEDTEQPHTTESHTEMNTDTVGETQGMSDEQGRESEPTGAEYHDAQPSDELIEARTEKLDAKIEVEIAKEQMLVQLIKQMDPDDESLWLSSGKPDLDALRKLAKAKGIDSVSATERDDAWAVAEVTT